MSSTLSETELMTYFEQLSNWGRWGDEDRLGTLNHITQEMRRDAAHSVENGSSVSLAWDIRPGVGGPPAPPGRFMLMTGEGLRDPERLRPPGFLGVGKLDFAVEQINMVFHGPTITHLDALSHVFWDGQMYNGIAAERVNAFAGATQHDVRAAAEGIVGRGVLLDAARWRGAPLEQGEGLHPEQLEAIETAQGVHVGRGDILLLRTGHDQTRRETGTLEAGTAGFAADCLPWLQAREVAAIGSDGINDIDRRIRIFHARFTQLVLQRWGFGSSIICACIVWRIIVLMSSGGHSCFNFIHYGLQAQPVARSIRLPCSNHSRKSQHGKTNTT